MRKSLFIPFLTLMIMFGSTFFTSALAQTKTEAEVKKLLCHKWQLTHIEVEGEKMEIPSEGSPTMQFKTDGTLIQVDDEDESKGKWSYDHKTMTLTLTDPDGTDKAKITKISETELVLNGTFDGDKLTMYFKKVN